MPTVHEKSQNGGGFGSPEHSVYSDTGEDDGSVREYDALTAACLEVVFPPFYHPTVGLSRPSTPIEEDKPRYWQLVDKSIDTLQIAPLQSDWITGMYRFVKKSLRTEFKSATKDFLEEMEDDYRGAVKKAMVDYVLLDPEEQERLGVPLPPKPSHSAGRESFPWHDRIMKSRDFMTTELYITHSIMPALLYHFEAKYGTFRLIDIPGLKKIMPITMESFLEHVSNSSHHGAKILKEEWLVECCDIIDEWRDNLEEWMPNGDQQCRIQKMDHFFGSVASLMSNLLRSCVEKSIHDLVDLVEDYCNGNKYEGVYNIFSGLALPMKYHPVTFFLNEDYLNERTTFYPTFDGICDIFNQIINVMVRSVFNIPRVETQLFQTVEDLETNAISTVHVEEEIVRVSKLRIRKVVDANSFGPQKYVEVYEPYTYLLKNATDKYYEKFITKDKSLREYMKEIEKLKKTADEIGSLPVYVPMHLFRLDCHGLNSWMIERARKLANIMITHIINTSRKFNRGMCTQYDNIVKRLTTQAETTEELVKLTAYTDNLRSGELLDLREKLLIAGENLMFLMDYAYLPKDDVLLNDNTFSWPDRIIPIIKSTESKLAKEHDIALNRLNAWQNKFQVKLDHIAAQIKSFSTKDRMSEAEQYVLDLENIGNKLDEFNKEKILINKEEALLNTGNQTPYMQIQEMLIKKEPYDKLWKAATKFHLYYEKWMNGPLLNVNAEEVEEEVQTLWRTAYKLTKIFAHPDAKGPMRASTTIKSKLEKFKINMPLINALCNPGIKQRHWDMMSERVGFNLTPKEDTPLIEMLQMGLEKYLDSLTDISSQASKEYALEKALEKMQKDWGAMHFTFVPYKETGISILSAFDDVQVLMDDHVVKTTTMKGSPFIGPFEKDVTIWDNQLHRMKAILDSWLKVQAAWLYLEPIFGSEDIRRQIPVEGKMFEEVDEHWKTIMSKSVEDTQALVVVSQDEMLEKLQHSESMLEDIQKGLNDYLEKKRLFFPRFFFLSNDELLEILSETKDPLRVQPHLKKCFEGIAKLNFTEDTIITAMVSAEKEVVDFPVKIVPDDAQGLVEKWLLQVEETMKLSLREVTKKAVDAYVTTPRKEWVISWPGQVVLAASTIHWTTDVELAIKTPGGLKMYLSKSSKQIDEIVALVRGKITKMARITLGALIVIDVHARDVIQHLADIDIKSHNDFNWVSQLRYYWEKNAVMVKMITTTVPYGYEYLGNSGRLVITPLTDRCYRTLMGALLLNLGGAPEGPAGTGKTETSKDLAKAVAKQCVVFNCSDGLDYKAMGKFFKGLAQAGAWACFDEFNRIELEVLSVVAQQIQTIQRAVAEQLETFVFEGTTLSLDPSCTIFITMNPGYAGRAELPDNLKVLFRTVAMMVPDYALIAAISLYSMGFVSAKALSNKIVATYRLCSELLSSQHHYDYG
ncbi:unnamed protein product, partial [Owenia fusiformis]